jgi:hypothetical protein
MFIYVFIQNLIFLRPLVHQSSLKTTTFARAPYCCFVFCKILPNKSCIFFVYPLLYTTSRLCAIKRRSRLTYALCLLFVGHWKVWCNVLFKKMWSAVQTLKGETQRRHVDLIIMFAVLKKERQGKAEGNKVRCFFLTTHVCSDTNSITVKLSTKQRWNRTDKGNAKYLEKALSLSHFVHHKPQVKWSRI